MFADIVRHEFSKNLARAKALFVVPTMDGRINWMVR